MARRIGRSRWADDVAFLDAHFSAIVQARDGHRCVVCGSRHNLTCSHFFGKLMGAARWLVRWLLENAVTMCFDCHREYEGLKGVDENGEPRPFRALMIKRLGKEGFEALQLKAAISADRRIVISKTAWAFGLTGIRWDKYA